MSKSIRCLLGRHKWEAQGTDRGVDCVCLVCGKRKTLHSPQPKAHGGFGDGGSGFSGPG